jgi:hypothetical protein
VVLHHWVEHGLHMIMNKFPLQELYWPPGSQTAIAQGDSDAHPQPPARLRADAHAAWAAAAQRIHDLGGTTGTEYASSPRSWHQGKQSHASGNSPFSWHYAALAVDISQTFYGDEGIVSERFRYVLENDGDKFRIWCMVVPQPGPAPDDPAQDRADPYVQYRNRNIRYRSPKPGVVRNQGQAADHQPLLTQNHTHDFRETAAPAGWYLDVTRVMEEEGMHRTPRHHDWQSVYKGWEWWHYEFHPPLPPGAHVVYFGDYLQLYGVHEYRLRNVNDGWPTHDDIEHTTS